MDSGAALLIGVIMMATLGSTWQQANPYVSRSLSRFHTRTTSDADTQYAHPFMALTYGEEVLGMSYRAFGHQLPAVPLRLDYHPRSGADTPLSRRIVLCGFGPEVTEAFPEFIYAEVCR